MDAAPAGSTVTAPACLYRERVEIYKSLTLVGSPGAEIRGSDLWTNWNSSGSTWVSTLTVPSLYNPGSSCQSGTTQCHFVEQVYRDGVKLLPVASGTTPTSGQFSLDGSRHVIVADNPSGHQMEVSTRTNWIWVAASDVTIKGFTMRYVATWAQGGGIQAGGFSVGAVDRMTVTNCALFDSHGRDIDLEGGTGHVITNNEIARAGDLGIGGGGGSNWTISNNRLHDNDVDLFDVGNEAGAIKVTGTSGVTVTGNEIDHNNGRGFWTDTATTNITVTNNRIHHNQNNGVFIEASSGISVHDNAVWSNTRDSSARPWFWGGGITLSSSSNAEVYNNTLAWNGSGITVISQQRGDVGQVSNVNVHDNTIAQDIHSYGTGWAQDWSGGLFDASHNNRGKADKYWVPTTEGIYAWNGDKTTLSSYAATPADPGAIYITTAQRDSALNTAGIPTAP